MWKHGFIVREVHLVVTDSRLARNFYSLLLNTNPVVLKDRSYFNLEGSKLLLREESHALKLPPGSSGLYHVAFVVDSLEGLAEVFRRILEYRLPLLGASDHVVL
jgi:catechol 2,3-dioxygenase